MVKAGLPVPPGFVVSTDGYSEYIRVNDLEDVIDRSLKNLDYENLDELEKRTGKIRESIIAGNIPDELTEEIIHTYGKFSDEPYIAVRSSGTAEDLAGASFAGQYETFLDVKEKKPCWMQSRGAGPPCGPHES
jgi:pyruvate,water dikinase